MSLTLANLDDLTTDPANIGTPTRLDADVTVSSNYNIQFLTITGLLNGDTLSFDPASEVRVVVDLGNLHLLYIGTALVGNFVPPVNAANGYSFRFSNPTAQHVETVIEAMTFSTTVVPGTPETAQRNLNFYLTNADAEEVSVNMTINIGEPDNGLTLDGFDDRTVTVEAAQSPVLLDSDVSFSITTATLAGGVTVTVTGFTPNDVPGINTGDGSLFSLQGNLLYYGTGDRPDYVGMVTLGEGAMTIGLADNPLPERIEALIENLTIANPAGAPLSRTITITVTDSNGTEESQSAEVRIVPEIASLADTVAFLAGSEADWQHLDTSVMLGSDPTSTSGGSLTISGLAWLDEIGLEAPAGSGIILLNETLMLGSTPVGSVTKSEGSVTFTFENGIGHANIDTILSSLAFRNFDTRDPAQTRDLTFTVVNAAGKTVAIDQMTVEYATISLTDVAGTATVPAGSILNVLDSDVTLTVPEGLVFSEGVTLRAKGVSVLGDKLMLNPGAESGLTLTQDELHFNGVQVGTLISEGTMVVEPGIGGQLLVYARDMVVQLNANASAAAVEAIIEAIGMTTPSTPTPLERDVRIELAYRSPEYGNVTILDSADITVTVTPPTITGLDDSVTYALGNAPRLLDSALTLPVVGTNYNGVTITISGLEAGDDLRPVIGTGNSYGFLTGPDPDSGSIALLGGVPLEFGAWTRTGSDLAMAFTGFAQQPLVEGLIEALAFWSTNPDPERVLTYTVSTGAGVYAQDSITVNIVTPIEVDDLVETLRINTADAAGVTVIDTDVTLVAVDNDFNDKDFNGGTLVVSSPEPGDVLTLIEDNGLALRNIGLPDLGIFVPGGIWIGIFKVLDGGFEITFTGSATAAHVELLLENIGFSTIGTPPVRSRDVTLTLTDADGTTATKTVQINVLEPTEQALDYAVLTGEGTVAASGLAQDLDPAALFEAAPAPDSFTVHYSGLFEVGAMQVGQQVFFDWTGPVGTVLRVNGVDVAAGAGVPALMTLAPGLHRIEFVVPHSAQGGSVTSAVPSLQITQGYQGTMGPEPSAPYQPLLSAARATPELIYRVDATFLSTEVLQQVSTTYERTVFVVSPVDVEPAVVAILEALPSGAYISTEVTQAIVTPIRVGTAGNDTLAGVDGENIVIEGGYGDDVFVGGAGADTMDGGAGLDTVTYAASATGVSVNLQTGTGDRGDVLISIERVIGSAHADALTGSDGNDTLGGGQGADTLLAGAGTDLLWGGSGDDLILAGAGNDRVLGGTGRDLINGDDGDDNLLGGADDDSLYGGTGNDTLSGGTGSDMLSGGEGNDLLFGGEGDDVLTGGAGLNSMRGGAGDDLLVGGADQDSLIGDEGNDTLQGGSGNDTLHGGDGDDVVMAAAGDDLVTGGGGDDLIDGGAGADTLSGNDGNDILTGGTGDDSVTGGSGFDLLMGGDGNDTLAGGAGADTLDGGLGADVFVFGRSDLRTGVDLINGFVRGVDKIALTDTMVTFLEGRGGTVADAIVWNGETGTLSLDLGAVGRSGVIDLAQVNSANGPLTLTMDDILLL